MAPDTTKHEPVTEPVKPKSGPSQVPSQPATPPVEPKAEVVAEEEHGQADVEQAEPKEKAFEPVEFWHPHRKNVQYIVPGGRRIHFVDGYYKARTPQEVEFLRKQKHVYEADIPKTAPDLVVIASGWRTRNIEAFQIEANLAAARGR